ncbi:MAG TPA: hypothetical protein P5164_13275, partial [Thermoanaerobaculia bacterium]|nr:hypothetical protein [Thermoanaerobaculia bacterium]
MTDRVDLLEERVAALSAAVAALEGRLGALEGRPAAARPAEAGAEAAAARPEADEATALPTVAGSAPAVLAGRAFLGVGGAFLFRTLTEAGTLPHAAGVALGLTYAAAWILAADRSGRAGRRADAVLHSFLGLAVSLPLLWESTARLQALSPGAAAGLLAAVGVAVFSVAWRHDLASAAWAATLGAVGTAWALLLATARIELFTVLLIGFGAATLWATYGRRWHGLRWPAALGADLAVLALVTLGARPGGPPAAWTGLSPGRAVAVALLLFVVYAGSFAARTLARRRDVNVFEVFQTAAVLLVGYGGAVRLAQAAGSGERALGVAALVLAALAYGASFGFVSREAPGARNFAFFSSLAIVLALTGGGLLASGPTLAVGWTLFGLAAALLGVRFGRRSLLVHGAGYLAAASVPSGLVGAGLAAFSGPGAPLPSPPGAAAGGVALVAAACWAVSVGSRRSGLKDGAAWAPRTLLLAIAAAGAGAALVALSVRALPPGSLAPVRATVFAAAAVG